MQAHLHCMAVNIQIAKIHVNFTNVLNNSILYTVGRVLNAWFNDYVVGKSGQSTNPIITNVDPIPYSSICARLCL